MRLRSVTIPAALPLVIYALLALSLAADRAPSGRGATVADLAQGLGRLVDPEMSARLARDFAAGPRGATPLTEGVAASMLRSAGVAATTLDPARNVSSQRLQAILRGAESRLAPVAVGGSSGQAASRGPERGSGTGTSSLDDCFVLENHGKCVECCKELGGGAATCAKDCFIINKPSAGEPIP
jgi:hypothetical protein